jgi:hypothetical protein
LRHEKCRIDKDGMAIADVSQRPFFLPHSSSHDPAPLRLYPDEKMAGIRIAIPAREATANTR